MKKMYRWDDKTKEKLVELYEAQKCLWDETDPNHKNRDERKKAYESIACDMRLHMHLEDFNTKACNDKINYMRYQYRRKLEEILNGEKTHSSAPPWFKMMDKFLRPQETLQAESNSVSTFITFLQGL
jgi:hypothetical protein